MHTFEDRGNGEERLQIADREGVVAGSDRVSAGGGDGAFEEGDVRCFVGSDELEVLEKAGRKAGLGEGVLIEGL